MQKNGNQEMKSKPNQVSWDERLKKLIGKQSNTGDLSGEIYPAYYLYESVESFISSLLKEERVKAYKQGFNKATEYAKYAIATNNMFENSVKAVRKQVKFEASRRAKSKLSKGKV